MTQSQRAQVALSETRERLNAIGELTGEDLTDEIREERRRLVAAYPDQESAYRAAVISESECETRGSQDAVDGETRATITLLRESRMHEFLTASAEQRTVAPESREGELLAALGETPAVGMVPMRLLDPLLDPHLDPPELRADAITELGASNEETQLSTRTWLDRVFLRDGGAGWLGVLRESVPAGVRRYVVVTSGSSAATVARGAQQDASAFNISTFEAEPKRMSARYVYRLEDMAKHGGELESSLRRDLRAVITEQHERSCIAGETGQITGLVATSSPLIPASNQTSLKAVNASKPSRDDLLTALFEGVDGRYATEPNQVKVLLNRAVYNRIAKTLASTTAASLATVLRDAQDVGFMVMSSDFLPTATASNTIIGLMAKQRGVMGSLCEGHWQTMTVVTDPYSRQATGELVQTMNTMWSGPVMVRSANWRQLKSAA